MPVPTAVPPSGSAHSRGSVSSQARDAVFDLRRVAAELLAERHRRRVHEVRAAATSRRARTRAASCAAPCASCSHAGIRSSATPSAAARCTADGNTSFDDCDAFTWSFGCTGVAERVGRQVARSPRSRSCSTTCPSRSGTRRSGSASSMRAVGDLVGRGRDRVGDRLRSTCGTSRRPAFTRAASALISAERPDQRGRRSGGPRSGSSRPPAGSARPTARRPGTRTSPIESCSTRYESSAIGLSFTVAALPHGTVWAWSSSPTRTCCRSAPTTRRTGCSPPTTSRRSTRGRPALPPGRPRGADAAHPDQAMLDIAHLLRPGHLAQLARDPRRSRGVAERPVRRARAAEERVHRGGRRPARRARTPAPRS